MKSDRRARPAPANSDVAALLAALRSESSDDRKTAAASLTGSIDRPEVLAAVTAALSDTAPKVRKSAAMSLARGGQRGRGPLARGRAGGGRRPRRRARRLGRRGAGGGEKPRSRRAQSRPRSAPLSRDPTGRAPGASALLL